VNLLADGEGDVSIQLVSPASGETDKTRIAAAYKQLTGVSIQLVSPASGEIKVLQDILTLVVSFHSISFPSEWGGSVPEWSSH
jgi:hypothetical protein